MTSNTTRSTYHHGHLKKALLDAAEALLREEGVQGLTLRACARRAGVSHAAPKHHFADVAELVSEVAARSFDRLTGALKTAREQGVDDPTERIVTVARTYVDFARTYPDHFRLMFRWDAVSSENEALRLAASRTFAELTTCVTLQRGESEVTPETLGNRIQDQSLQSDVVLAWSQIHGYAQLLLEGQFDGFAEAEGMDAFVERTVVENAIRVSRVLQSEQQRA
jgi:AcrR family transcriptional regulator